MKTPSLLLSALLFASSVSANDRIITLGDSLTFAYEAEFCFSQTVSPYGTFGDGFPLTVRNWIEILSDPAYRGSQFDLGTRDDVLVTAPDNPSFTKYFRQSRNWAIPGLTVDGMRRFLTGDATFSDLLDDDPSFSLIDLLLTYSDYTNSDFDVATLQGQIQNEAERLVIFVGGNDIKSVYSDIYNGLGAGTFVDEFIEDMTSIIEIVQGLNANLPIVLVNVPHVGITPKVRAENGQPPDPVGVERVAEVLRELNGRLAELAASKHIGYADIYTPTVHMALGSTYPLVIHGQNIGNSGNAAGGLGQVWLNGDLSANFHPNTSAQAVIANEIILAFNRRYGTGIAPLTATEILGGLLEKKPTEIDMPFSNWMTQFFKPGSPPVPGADDDFDGDGIPAAVEFALGLNPRLKDADRVSLSASGAALELAYPLRLASSTQFALTPESAGHPAGPYTPLTPPSPGSDGQARALVPIGASPAFLHLKAELP